jgi:hypothetical protein
MKEHIKSGGVKHSLLTPTPNVGEWPASVYGHFNPAERPLLSHRNGIYILPKYVVHSSSKVS